MKSEILLLFADSILVAYQQAWLVGWINRMD